MLDGFDPLARVAPNVVRKCGIRPDAAPLHVQGKTGIFEGLRGIAEFEAEFGAKAIPSERTRDEIRQKSLVGFRWGSFARVERKGGR